MPDMAFVGRVRLFIAVFATFGMSKAMGIKVKTLIMLQKRLLPLF